MSRDSRIFRLCANQTVAKLNSQRVIDLFHCIYKPRVASTVLAQSTLFEPGVNKYFVRLSEVLAA